MFVQPKQNFDVLRTTATLEDLQIKAGLMPEGVDLLRLSPDELRELLEQPAERIDTAYKLPLKSHYDPVDPKLVWTIYRAKMNTEDQSPKQDPLFIDAERAIAAQRQAENLGFSDRWITDFSPAAKLGVLVVPQAIAFDGQVVQVSGKYCFNHEPSIDVEGAKLDTDGWAPLAEIEYDFTKNRGKIVFTNSDFY